MPDTKIEAGRSRFGKALWPSIRNPRSSTLAVPGHYRRLVKLWPNRARMSIRILHFIGLRRQPLTRPSAFAKATADRPATLSHPMGREGGGAVRYGRSDGASVSRPRNWVGCTGAQPKRHKNERGDVFAVCISGASLRAEPLTREHGFQSARGQAHSRTLARPREASKAR